MRLSTLIAIGCLIITNLFGQAKVSAELDTTTILLGDQLRLKLKVQAATTLAELQSNTTSLDTLSNVEIVEVRDWDSENTGDLTIFYREIILTSFDSGYYYIPSIPISFTENGVKKTQRTNRLGFAVQPLPSAPISDIKNIIREGFQWEDLLPYLIGLLVILLIVGIIVFIIKKRKKKEKYIPPPPLLPAHIIALNELDKLRSAKLWQAGKIKAYQSQLTHIIREYLENRYKINALEMTTDQILRQLKAVDFEDDLKKSLQNILQMADLIKFAKAEPPADIHEQFMKQAEDLVEKTKLKIIINETTQ